MEKLMDILVRIRREEGTRLYGGTVRLSGGVIATTTIVPFVLACTIRNRPKRLEFLRQGKTLWKLAMPRLADVLQASKDPRNRAFIPLMASVFEAHIKLITGEGMECYYSSSCEDPCAELEAAVREVFYEG